jgi:hypothetical protein
MTHRYFPGVAQEKSSTTEKKIKKFSVVNDMFVRQYYTQRAFVCKAGRWNPGQAIGRQCGPLS